ncbi:MAG TPA: HAD family hydrolase, partial [Verrucomicrobiae bacterium]
MKRAKSPKGIRALTFDVGGTLIEPWPSVGHIYADEASKLLGVQLAPAELNERFYRAWNSQKQFGHSREAWRELVTEIFSNLVPECPESFFNALYHRFEVANAWKVFDDVRPILEELRSRGLRLGIVSNWDERLKPLLKDLQLEHYFQRISVSLEVGLPKP